MKCPQCVEKLSESDDGGHRYYSCKYCDGVWLPLASTKGLVADAKSAALKIDFEKLERFTKVDSQRHCPACADSKLEQFHINQIELDICPQCHGIFFDADEARTLLPKLDKSNSKAVTTWDVIAGVGQLLLAIIGASMS